MDFLNVIENINNHINSVVWGPPMLLLIITTGIYMSFRTGFFQFRKFKHVLDQTFLSIFKNKKVTKTKDKKAITQFQSLTTVLASTMGTGNIAGVSTAIAIGGAGSVFWMWVSAIFGMMTIYSENVLGIYFRKKNKKGEWSGGPMYYLEEGLAEKKFLKKFAKPLAILFSIFCVLASFGIGNMTQVNSISSALESDFHVSTLTTGIILAICVALVILGGIKRIGKVTEKLVPVMAIFYIVSTLTIFVFNFKHIPNVFYMIFSNAFSFKSVAGGVGGYVVLRAVTLGFKRGIFSNEAGLGSSVMVNSSADVVEPVKQGMWGIFEAFIDTIIVCTLTAFVLLSSSNNAKPLDKALNNISLDTQYVKMCDENSEENNSLINNIANESIVLADSKTPKKDYGTPLKMKTIYGKTLYLNTVKTNKKKTNDYIYTNLMTIKGIPKTDSKGNIVKDENKNPIISSVKITPVNGVPLVSYAFSQVFGKAAGKMLSIAIIMFAFSTVLGWSFYGVKSMEYMFGTKSTFIYKVIFLAFIVIGSTMELQLVWDISDTLNALMAIPNLIGVLALSTIVLKVTKNYSDRTFRKKNVNPLLSKYSDIQLHQEFKKYEE